MQGDPVADTHPKACLTSIPTMKSVRLADLSHHFGRRAAPNRYAQWFSGAKQQLFGTHLLVA
jgi:hypothetical protein